MHEWIDWRMDDPRYQINLTYVPEDKMAQRQWTIEARADFSDSAKNELINKAVRQAAAHINAQLTLISDGQKPKVVCFSDDFFHGHQDISLYDDIGEALSAHGDTVPAEGVSDELLQVAKELGSK